MFQFVPDIGGHLDVNGDTAGSGVKSSPMITLWWFIPFKGVTVSSPNTDPLNRRNDGELVRTGGL
jgi:hypothetical protein